ncbi:MAG: hypothetical protein MAG451_02823 [Anaerolineales bacterium]|nr:hypothetical protein [Anaerolineales bacterium]
MAHRLAGISDEKARFYQYALPALGEFEHAKSFPGGFTRTTAKKLRLTKIPQFVDTDLTALVQAAEELAEVKRRIQLTDDLIDQIVYRLYGLTEEEIAIVEGRA